MPEFIKRDTATGFFPGQCFTCITAVGPFWYLGEAAGYGTVIMCGNCARELGMQEGLSDAGLVEKFSSECIELRRQNDELQDQVRIEKTRQVQVVSLADALKLRRASSPKKPVAKKKPEPTPAA